MSISATNVDLSPWKIQLLPALPLIGYAIFISESVSARPNPFWAAFLLLWTFGATLLAWWLIRGNAGWVLGTVDRHASGLAIGMIIIVAVIFITINILQTYYFSPGRDAEDTAYYSQILWNTLHGNFLSGNVLQERLFNPPVSNDLALHVSPVLLGFLPVYACFPHFLTILIIRDVVLAVAAWPLFLLARERMGGTAGVAVVVLYLANPAVVAQVFDAFHLLQLAPFPFFYALRAFAREELGNFLCWVGIALSLREDVAVALAGFGLWAFVIGRQPRWWSLGLGIPIVWWGLTTLLIQPAFGRWGNQVSEIAFAGGGPASLGIYQILLGDPSWILGVLRENGLYDLYRLLRSVAFLGILGWEGLLAAPILAANLFLARMLPDAVDPISRFAVLPACALIGAAVLVVDRLGRNFCWDMRAFAVILLLLFPSVSLLDGVKDAAQERSAASLVHNDAAALREGMTYIPDTASVAAPKYALPALANRAKLFFLQNFHEYPHVQVDYFLLDRNLDRFELNPERRQRYVALLDELSRSVDYEVVWQQGGYVLVHRKDGTPPQ